MDPRFKKVLMTLLLLSLTEDDAAPSPEQDPLYQEPPEKRPQYPIGSQGYYLKQLQMAGTHRTWPEPVTGINGGTA